MTRFPGETTTASEQTRSTWLLAALRRTRRAKTVCSEGKQHEKHSDTSSLRRKREVKLNPLGLHKNWLDSLRQTKSSTRLDADRRRSTEPRRDQTGLF